MIFVAKNEEGTPTWQLIKDRKKKVTSRVNLVEVGKSIAIQPGRGKKSVCRRTVVSCMNRLEHYHKSMGKPGFDLLAWKQKEAELEGFLSWNGLMHYFDKNKKFYDKHKMGFMDLYRIELEDHGGIISE